MEKYTVIATVKMYFDVEEANDRYEAIDKVDAEIKKDPSVLLEFLDYSIEE